MACCAALKCFLREILYKPSRKARNSWVVFVWSSKSSDCFRKSEHQFRKSVLTVYIATQLWDHGISRIGSKISVRAVFNLVSKVIRVLLWFFFRLLRDWLKNLPPLFRPIRSKTQTNPDLVARVFPRLARVTWICFEVWLVYWVVCVCCDWLG